MSSFQRLGVIPELIQATQKLDWLLPTPVQDEAIPLILGGGDVMVAAETGSGKTAAFAIPILQIVYETLRGDGASGQAIIEGESDKKSNVNIDNQATPAIKLSPTACDKLFTITDNGLKGASSTTGWLGGRTNIGVISGKYYYEATIITGSCRIGWCTSAHTQYTCGSDSHSWGYGYTAKKAHDNDYVKYGIQYGESDVIGCYIDFKKKEISYSVNNKYLGPAYKNISALSNQSTAVYPCCVSKKGTILFNFGATPFRYKPRNGFYGIQSVPLKKSSIYFRQLMIDRDLALNKKNRGSVSSPLALILAPTRDLAQQIYDDTEKLGIYCTTPQINTCLCIGGVSTMMNKIIKAHIVVGTIGSICGLIKTKKLTLSSCKFFTLDEADRVLDPKQGSQNDILAMYSRLPNDVQIMLFSATLHSDAISNMSNKLCKNPIWVDLKGKDFVPDTVHHCILVVDPIKDNQWRDNTNPLINNIVTDGVHNQDNIQYNARGGNMTKETKSEAVKTLKPLILKKVIDAFKMDQCLIFCRTRLDCDNLTTFLTSIGGGKKFFGATSSGKENPYSCIALHSGIPQYKRGENLKLFKNGDVRFLICTDVAARGIDIKYLPYVINITMPAEDEDYIHRVGRVGRADHPGIAISIISSIKEKVWYHANCSNRGKGCFNTVLVKNGGCCKWYDEVKIFEAVEKRLGGNPIPILDQNKHLNAKSKIHDFVKTVQSKDPLMVLTEQKLKKLLPTITELNKLEIVAQNQYLNITNKFTNIFNIPININTPTSTVNVNNKNNKKKRKRGRDKKKKKRNINQFGPAKG